MKKEEQKPTIDKGVEFEKTLRVYQEVIDSVMGATEHKFVGTSQAYKVEFRQKWAKIMKEELESYVQEEAEVEAEEAKRAEESKVKTEKEVKEEEKDEEGISQPAAKKAKVDKKDDDDVNEEILSDGDDDDDDDLIKKETDEKDPNSVITGVTTGCKTNRGKWKGDILNCVLQRKGYPEILFSKCSCVFNQDGK